MEKTVGIITRQPLLNDYLGRSVFDLVSEQSCAEDNFLFSNDDNKTFLKENDDYVAEAYNQSSYLNLTLRLISMLLKNGYEVDLRIHPRESDKNWKKIKRRFLKKGFNLNITSSSEPYLHWAMRVAVIVGPASTSFYECLSCGVPVISLSAIDKSKLLNEDAEENQDFMNFIESPETLVDVQKSIESKIKGSKRNKSRLETSRELKALFNRQINYPDNKAINKIVKDLLSCKQKRSYIIIRYYISFVLVFLNAYLRFFYNVFSTTRHYHTMQVLTFI